MRLGKLRTLKGVVVDVEIVAQHKDCAWVDDGENTFTVPAKDVYLPRRKSILELMGEGYSFDSRGCLALGEGVITRHELPLLGTDEEGSLEQRYYPYLWKIGTID